MSQISILSLILSFIGKSPLQILPLKSFPGSNDISCRHCSTKIENTIHVLNGCSSIFHKMTLRHNDQHIVTNLLDIMDVEYTDLFISPVAYDQISSFRQTIQPI